MRFIENSLVVTMVSASVVILFYYNLSRISNRKQFQMLYNLKEKLDDVSKQCTQSEKEVTNIAYYDSLTKLPNRNLFNKHLNDSLKRAKLNNEMIAVLFLDFDRFRNINDALGHFAGDQLLKEISLKLLSLFHKVGKVSRLGGDEFLILLPEVKSKKVINDFVEKTIDEFKKSITIDGYQLYITVSIGISIFPIDGIDVESLIKNADTAMYKAKDLGRDNYQFYTQDMNKVINDSFQFANSLRSVVERRELEIHYQPQIDISTDKIVGLEALLRWKHPILGYIPPDEFISIAEETGSIVPIGNWVLRTSCEQNKIWHKKGFSKIKVAVNISARQLQQPDFYETVVKILKECEFDPHFLELEITETIAVRNIENINKILNKLREIGIKIAMDDFGTGYSALSCLNQIALDVLKIDKSFIQGLTEDNGNKEIADAIIKIAHNLGLKVVAEGVETINHVEFLKEKKCDYLQGFYYSKPLPPEKIEVLLIEKSLYEV